MAAAPSIMLLLSMLLPLPIVAGLVLIIMSWRKGGPFPACGQCGYNVSASIGTTTRCPECGSEFGSVGITPTKSRTSPVTLSIGLALVGLPLIVMSIGLMSMGASQRRLTPAILVPPPPPAPPIATQPATPAALPPPLTQVAIDAMSAAQLQEALSRISEARTRDPAQTQRLRDEFRMLLDRVREIHAEQPN